MREGIPQSGVLGETPSQEERTVTAELLEDSDEGAVTEEKVDAGKASVAGGMTEQRAWPLARLSHHAFPSHP